MKKTIFILAVICILTGCKTAPDSSNVSIGKITVIPTPKNTYFAGFWPDGKLNFVQKDEKWQLFWGEADSVLTETSSTWPENHFPYVLKENVVFGESKKENIINGLNENGSWFIGVFPLSNEGHYVGFFHGESHWYSREDKKNDDPDAWTAHKSIGVTYSYNYGKTWEEVSPLIIDSKAKPSKPDWTGLGDGCVIWDEVNSRWICYYQGPVYDLFGNRKQNSLCMAASYDKEGKPGTWNKWDGKNFTIEAYNSKTGLGGKNVEIANLSSVPGANPSVMWNEYLKRWVMVYASWEHKIYISFSDNGEDWSKPERILGNSKTPIWYPNLISPQGDKSGGQTIRMYFSYNQKSDGKRDLAYCELTF